jgi:hypothetical protein
VNNQKVAAALRLLAEAFETPAATADLPPAQPETKAEPAKRGRGRPVAGESSPAPAPAPAATEPDPFDAAPPAASAPPVATLEEVRGAMKALAAATTQENALSVLKAAGGVSNLTELQRTPEKYGVVVAAAKAASTVKPQEPEADPFETTAPAAAPEQKAATKEDVKAALVKAQKRTGVDIVQGVVMKHGGKAAGEGGAVGPSLTALPISAYAAVIAEVEALPTTK